MPTRVIASYVLPAAEADSWHLLRAGHIACGTGYRIERQRHAGHEWLLCLRGRGTAWCGKNRCNVAAGELIWLDNRLPHGHAADPNEPWELLWVRCHGPDLGRWRERLGGDSCLRVVPRDVAGFVGRLRDLLRLAGERDRFPAEMWAAGVQASLTGLLAEIVAVVQRGGPAACDPAVARLQTAMLADLAGTWGLRRLLQAGRLPASSLYRRFRRATGLPPLAWLRRRRLERAAELLHVGGTPVAAVAAATGFTDPFHFSREFRAAFGLSPRAFRRAEGGD